mgnify:CR=1 FL=1
MADHVDITLRIDWRWKDAIEKHLRDEIWRMCWMSCATSFRSKSMSVSAV